MPQTRIWGALPRTLVVLTLLAYAAGPAGATDERLPAVKIDADHGFIDIDLPITDLDQAAARTRIIARGDIEGSVVGFELELTATNGGSVKRPLPVGAARLRTLGADSDRFVTLLAKLYKLPTVATKMVPAVDASTVGLEGDPARILNGATKMKFFFYDSGPEDRYAEVYINIDSARRVLEFHEKDPDYRKPLLLAFTSRP